MYMYLRCTDFDMDTEEPGDDGRNDRLECPLQQGIHHPGYLPYRMLRILMVLAAAVWQHGRSWIVKGGHI